MILYHRNIGGGGRIGLRDLESTLNKAYEESWAMPTWRAIWRASDTTLRDGSSARVRQETTEIPDLKIEPVRIKTSPRMEANRCAQRKTHEEIVSSGGPRGMTQPHWTLLVTRFGIYALEPTVH
jgi:hypothetical protein